MVKARNLVQVSGNLVDDDIECCEGYQNADALLETRFVVSTLNVFFDPFPVWVSVVEE